MKKLTLFLVAIFAMVNVANAQRAWAYDLELTPSVDSYTFAFKAVTAGDATLVFYKDGIEAAILDLGSVSAGDNTVTKTSEELLGAIQQSGDFTWGVKMSAGAIALNGNYTKEVTDGSKSIYKFYLPQGVVVDNNPESETFGTFFIAAATDGQTDGSSERADGQKRGVFVYDQTLSELNPTSNVGIIPSNVTLSDASRQAMHRIAVNPVNNQVAFAYNVSGSPAVWSVPANNPAGEATNLIAGTEITMPNSICFDENGALYVMDNANATTGGTLYKVVDGIATKIAQNTTWQNIDNSLAYDGRGGLWIAQSHDGNTWPSYEILSHVNSVGVIDWKSSDYKTSSLFSNGNSAGFSKRGQCAYSPKDDLLAFGGNKRCHIFQVTYDTNGVPSLGTTYKYRTPFLSATNVDGLAFDYAGDLYLMSASAERFYKYAIPTTDNTCTVPAKKSQVITLVSATPEYNVTIGVNGNGNVTGANTGTYLEGTELTLTATPAEHYEFTGWTGDVNSTENPLTITVDGNKNITANFAKKQYTLTVLTNDENKGTVTGAGTYDYGMVVTIEAIAQPGYKLLYWSDRSKELSRTITMNKNEALSAYFVKEYAVEPTFTIEKVWENAQVPAATGDGYQAVGWDQKIYMQNKTAGKIQVFSNGTDATVDYATSGTGQQIAVDEAGNLIVFNAYFATSTPNSVLIYKKGDATGTAVSFTLQDPARCDFFSASGDIYSAEGGYVYFYCAGKTVINRLKITNGAATETDVMTDVVGESVYSSPQNTNYVMVDIFGNLVAHARSNAINAINVYTNETKSFALPSIKMGTLGGCSFELGGKELWAYHAGATNYSSEWNIYNMTDSKFLSDTVLYAIDKTNSSNNACNWLNVQVIDENTAYIYQFCPKKAAAVWKVTRDVSYTVSATATNGTVSGTGVYKAGTTATLTATPNTGYKFINWTKGEDVVSTEATYSFTVSEDVALVANFEALPKTPRAWAYNLKRGEEGDNYTFTFTATAAGQATILFEDVEGNPIAPTYHEVGAIEAGEKTVVIAKSAFEGAKDVYWSVKMDGAPIEGVVEITDASKGIYNFYLPQGVVVDNNPESKTFGTIFVAESTDGASDGGSDRAKAQKRGIFVYDQTLAELNPTSNVGILPSNVTLENTTRNALKRIAINPKTNEVAFAYNATPAAVWAVSTENVAGEATNMLDGLRFEYCNSLCFGEDGTLYVFDNGAGYPAKGSLYKIVAGEAIAIFSEHAKYGNADNSLVADGHGGLWISQNRGQLDGFNQLAHVNANGEIDFEVNSATPNGFESLSTARGALAYNPREDILAIGIGTSSAIGVSLYHVEYHIETGVPTLEFIGSVPALGKNVEGIAFDYAGDLYAVSANAERMYKFALPSKDNICTVPAPESEAIKKEVRYTVAVNIVGNGSVEGDGDYVVNTVANLIATPTVHNRFVDWKNGDLVVSTDKEYSITVTDNITLTATFEQIPQYTITTSVNDSKMGTVTEGGTYYEGTKVTLTAKANGGYVFVNWSDGNIEETRTIEVTSDLNLTANFKVATPRAWAYALNMVEDGEDYKFSFTATSAGNATIIFTDEDGNTIAPTQAVVGAVTAGENKTVNIAKTQFTGTKDIYWSVKVDGAPIEKMAEITDPSLGIYDIVAPQGIAIDNNTDSEYFGQVYVAAATDGEVSRGTQTRGIFVYNPILNELNTPNTGYLPANATLTNTTRQAIHRVAVNPTNSQVAFAYNISGSTAVWSMNPENLAGDAVNLIDGAGITKANSICFDENGILYVMDNANTGTGGKIYKIQNGVGDVFADAQAGNLWAVEDNAMTSDGRGGLWIAQNRWSVDGYPVLSHVNSNGQVDFAVSQNSSAELQALFPYDDNNASYRGQCAYYVAEDILAFAGNKEAVLFKITYDANDVPTNLEKLMSTGKLGTNIDGVAFDYAGDLYVASETTKRFYKFVVPTNNNTCTVPAPASQVIKKEQRYTVTVSVNDDAMGTATGGGEYKAGETIMLTATANAGYRFVNWTYNNTTSTDNPLSLTVEGDISVTANFEEKPLEMVGVVKRAVQIGESTIVLTHEADGTPHLYKVVDGELETEISQEGVEAAAAGYLSISDIAATEDGKLVACNYIECTYTPSNTSYFYIWNNLADNPTIWFTSQKSTNYNNAYMGYTMAVKGTSTDAVVTISGFNKSNKNTRFSHLKLVGGVYNEANYEYSRDNDALHTNTLGNSYELNASPLANENWIVDGELSAPIEFVGKNGVAIDTYTAMDETLLGKEFNGATYLTVEDKHLMVAPYADANGKVAGVKVIDITNGLAAAQVLETLNLDDPAEATAAATAVLQDEYGLIITLVTDATLHRLEYTTAEVYTRSVTNGDFGTICLPYGSSNMTGAVFYEVAGQEPGKVYLDQVTTLEAGKPYIFRATASTITVVYEGDEALSAGNHNGLYGTFTDNTTVEQGNYIVYNNELRLCGTGCYINAYRAYLNLTAVTSDVPAPMPGRQRIGMNVQGGNETTALDNITEGNGTIIPTMEGTYDVLGRKLTQPTTTGVYIINGKKVFVVK